MKRDYAWADARRAKLKAELAAIDAEFPHSERPRQVDTFLRVLRQSGPEGVSFTTLAEVHGISRDGVKRFLHRDGLKETQAFVHSRGQNGGVVFATAAWRDAAVAAEKAAVAYRRQHRWEIKQAKAKLEYAAEVARKAAPPKPATTGPVVPPRRPNEPTIAARVVDPQDCRPWARAACGG